MRSLYRMSRTAGVGLGDYAAVNVLSVVGLLLAVASILTLVFADVTPMLVIPIAAMLVSLVAFLQVRASNGTQTGKAIALTGLGLAVLIAGTNVYGRVSKASAHRRDEVTLRGMVENFSTNVLKKNMPAAYDLFDDRFKEAVGLDTFDRTVSYRVANLFAGKGVTGMSLGQSVFFETDPSSGVSQAAALLFVHGTPTRADGTNVRTEEPIMFRMTNGQWKIHSITGWFDAAVSTKAKPR